MIKPIFLNEWYWGNEDHNAGKVGVMNDFSSSDTDFEGVEILLAYYSYEAYEGEAFVLFRKEGILYEVNGSHCSCYGLEGQWKPEEVLLEELEHRITKGKFGFGYGHDGYPNRYNNELKDTIELLKQNN